MASGPVLDRPTAALRAVRRSGARRWGRWTVATGDVLDRLLVRTGDGGPVDSSGGAARSTTDGTGPADARSGTAADTGRPADAGAPDAPVATDGGEVDPVALLCRHGVLGELPDGSDLALGREFAAAWIEAVDEVAGTTDDLRRELADVAGLDAGAIRLARRPGAFELRHRDGGAPIARWASKAACQADVATAAIVPLFDPEWGHRSVAVRSALVATVRCFLEVCPTCRGLVTLDEEVARSYVGRGAVVPATCEGCAARVFEVARTTRPRRGDAGPAVEDRGCGPVSTRRTVEDGRRGADDRRRADAVPSRPAPLPGLPDAGSPAEDAADLPPVRPELTRDRHGERQEGATGPQEGVDRGDGSDVSE